jgi:hypothetical protein
MACWSRSRSRRNRWRASSSPPSTTTPPPSPARAPPSRAWRGCGGGRPPSRHSRYSPRARPPGRCRSRPSSWCCPGSRGPVIAILGPRRPASWARMAIALAPAIAAAVLWTWWMRHAYTARVAGAGHALTLASYLRAQLEQPQRQFFVWIQLYWMGWGWVDVMLRKPAYLFISIVLAAAGVGIFKLRSGSTPERFLLVGGAVATAGLVATLHRRALMACTSPSTPRAHRRSCSRRSRSCPSTFCRPRTAGSRLRNRCRSRSCSSGRRRRS